MKIVERVVGDITILDLSGRIDLGEGAELLKARVNRIISTGRNKVVLNLVDVPYVDSAGNGELVRTFVTIGLNGGRLVLLSPSRRFMDQLVITKLITVYEVYDDEATALKSFGTVRQVSVCPVCHLPSGFGVTGQAQQCGNCLARTFLIETPGTAPRWIAERIELPTYPGAKVVLRAEWPYVIAAADRLDLFSAEAIEQAWLAVPRPRKALTEIPAGNQLATPKAVAVIASLCRPERDGGRTVVWHPSDARLPSRAPFFTDRAAAVEALWLADVAATQIAVDVRRGY